MSFNRQGQDLTDRKAAIGHTICWKRCSLELEPSSIFVAISNRRGVKKARYGATTQEFFCWNWILEMLEPSSFFAATNSCRGEDVEVQCYYHIVFLLEANGEKVATSIAR